MSAATAAGSAAAAASTRLGDLTASAVDRVIDKRTVTALVLPTGSDPGDFIIIVDLERTLRDLESGILVRPELVVWAHRTDLDQARLATLLEQSFSQQVAEFRTRRHGEVNLEARKTLTVAAAEESSADRSGTRAKKHAIAAGLAMLFVANPLLDLLLLGVAVTKGTDALLDALREGKASRATKRAKKDHAARNEEIKKTVRAKKKAFRVALSHLEIHVHGRLVELAEDYASLDELPLLPSPPSDGPLPDVLRELRSGRYKSALPSWYQPLLDARIEQWVAEDRTV